MESSGLQELPRPSLAKAAQGYAGMSGGIWGMAWMTMGQGYPGASGMRTHLGISSDILGWPGVSGGTSGSLASPQMGQAEAGLGPLSFLPGARLQNSDILPGGSLEAAWDVS